MIEPLETRIAPAAVFTFTDVDGDAVTVTTSKGTNAELAAIITPFLVEEGAGRELQKIDFILGGAVFAGTDLTVTAKRTSLGGDGLVNVGLIGAQGDAPSTSLDLGLVTIKGDLGRIDAGDSDTSTAAIKGLTVQSMGQFGNSTLPAGLTLDSSIQGALGFLKVAGSVTGAAIYVSGSGPNNDVGAKIGSVKIGGSLLGGASTAGGNIECTGPIGPVKIGGDVVGGAGASSGQIYAGGTLASFTLGGSLKGGADGGVIFSVGAMGAVKIGGNVVGGDAEFSGRISAGTTLASVTLGGSLRGGATQLTGYISSGEAMGAVKIRGDIEGGGGDASGRVRAATTLASLSLGGSLVGGAGLESGTIRSTGAMGAVTIGGDIEGGSGEASGRVATDGTLAAITLRGSLLGGSKAKSGEIASEGDMGPVKIGGDIKGGGASESGVVASGDSLASVTLGGDLIGGSANFTGGLNCIINMGPVKIGGDIQGTIVTPQNGFALTGFINAERLTSLFVGGSIISGTGDDGGGRQDSGSVRIAYDIGAIKIKGSLVGNATTPVLITAAGRGAPNSFVPLPPGATNDVAIKSLSVGGSVEFTEILAGYDLFSIPRGINADAQIGPVSVGGDWIASSLVAGAQDSDGGQTHTGTFGEADDQKIGGLATDTAARTSKIASIVIKGTALGTVGGDGHYGIVAQEIGSLTVAGTKFPLTAGRANDIDGLPVGITGDLRVREVAL